MPLYRNYLNSPVLTGTPTLPTGTTATTQATGDNTTKLATTQYVVKESEAINPTIYTYCGGL